MSTQKDFILCMPSFIYGTFARRIGRDITEWFYRITMEVETSNDRTIATVAAMDPTDTASIRFPIVLPECPEYQGPDKSFGITTAIILGW